MAWDGGTPRVEITHIGWFKGFWVTYGPQVLGWRWTFWSALHLAKQAKRERKQ